MERPFALTGIRSSRLVRRFAATIAVAGALLSGPSLAAGPSDYFCYQFAEGIGRVAAGPDGTVYVAGFTHTADLPASVSPPAPPVPVPGRVDPSFVGFFFVSALAPDGRPLWTSYVPGFHGGSLIPGIAVGTDGSVWLAGEGKVVPSGSDPVLFDDTDIVLGKFASDGAVVFAENVGGGAYEWPTDLALTPDGDAIVVGSTNSDDFPGTHSRGGYYSYNGADAFVMRIRADGSGPVWTRRFGGAAPSGPTRCDAGGVAVDTDGTIVVNFLAPHDAARLPVADGLPAPPESGFDPVPAEERPTPMYVVRLDASGETKRAASLGFMGAPYLDGTNGRAYAAIAFDRQRNILVGGMKAVAKLAPDLMSVKSAWAVPWYWDDGISTGRIRVDVDDTIAVVRVGRYGSGQSIYSLRKGEPASRWDDITGLYVPDLALDDQGNRVFLGYGEGTPFHVPSGISDGPAIGDARYIEWVAKLPRGGVSGPSNITVRDAGLDFVELQWEPGSDAVVRYDVEPNPYDFGPAPPATVSLDGPATSARVEGLQPASGYALRLVTEFASGVRTSLYGPCPSYYGPPGSPPYSTPWADSRCVVSTYALPPADVLATRGPRGAVDLSWTDTNGGRGYYEVERRFGDGPWLALTHPVQTYHLVDRVPDVALPLSYRVRGYAPDWVEVQAVTIAPTLRLVPKEGRLTEDAQRRGVFVVTGTIAAADPATPLAFNPATDELNLLWGDSRTPSELRITRGDTWWHGSGGVFRWSGRFAAYGLRPGSEVVIDPVRGRFRIELRLSSRVFDYPYSYDWWSGEFALNLAWGGFSGGSVDEWRHKRRPRRSLTLR